MWALQTPGPSFCTRLLLGPRIPHVCQGCQQQTCFDASVFYAAGSKTGVADAIVVTTKGVATLPPM
jgi:hypothetical protein